MDNKMNSVEMMATYNAEWYGDQENESYKSAKATLDCIAELLPNLSDGVTSVIDVGCGVGTWLKAWQEKYGSISICGIDGNSVESEHFFIPYKFFRRIDLTADSNMIVSEVLEHCKNMGIKTDTQNKNDTNSDVLGETMGGGGQTL